MAKLTIVGKTPNSNPYAKPDVVDTSHMLYGFSTFSANIWAMMNSVAAEKRSQMRWKPWLRLMWSETVPVVWSQLELIGEIYQGGYRTADDTSGEAQEGDDRDVH